MSKINWQNATRPLWHNNAPGGRSRAKFLGALQSPSFPAEATLSQTGITQATLSGTGIGQASLSRTGVAGATLGIRTS